MAPAIIEGGTMRITSTNVILVLACGACAVLPAAAAAEEQQCQGELGAVTVDNLRVPAASECVLGGTLVQGTLKVESGAALDATGIRVIGNVQAEDAREVTITSSWIGGSFQVKQGGSASLAASTVAGDVQLDSNRGALNVSSSQVTGSVQIFKNAGGASIAGNAIGGNLQCKENVSPPIGGGNVVQGNAEDQCAELAQGEGTLAAPALPVSSTSTGSHIHPPQAATPSTSITSAPVGTVRLQKAQKSNRLRCKRPRRRGGPHRPACRRQLARAGKGKRERTR